MKIAYIGNFEKLWDEEYIAQAFEELGHTVLRIPERSPNVEMLLTDFQPDIILWAKLNVINPQAVLAWAETNKVQTVCWVWDLYWGYAREYILKNGFMFKADKVFTSDGGHEDEWKSIGIEHQCVRQGIHEPDCYREEGEKEHDVVFVGTFNINNRARNEMLDKIEADFRLTWIGKTNPDEMRGPKLNRLFGQSKIIVGDSVYSPNYWSNRVVETLGRGGFLIHQEVPGLKEEYPHLVTYKKGDYADLKEKIGHYLQNPKQREAIIKKNFEWVRDNYTCKQKCQDLLTKLNSGKKD